MYAQGDPADTVFYIQAGRVRLAVLSTAGKEAVVATLGPGDFVGEGALAGHPVRMGTAKAVVATTALVIDKAEMLRVLHEQHALSDRFIAWQIHIPLLQKSYLPRVVLARDQHPVACAEAGDTVVAGNGGFCAPATLRQTAVMRVVCQSAQTPCLVAPIIGPAEDALS